METYPSIDHKISVYYGYINCDEIGGIYNLCICSRYINNKKGILNENEFKEKLKNNFFNLKEYLY